MVGAALNLEDMGLRRELREARQYPLDCRGFGAGRTGDNKGRGGLCNYTWQEFLGQAPSKNDLCRCPWKNGAVQDDLA